MPRRPAHQSKIATRQFLRGIKKTKFINKGSNIAYEYRAALFEYAKHKKVSFVKRGNRKMFIHTLPNGKAPALTGLTKKLAAEFWPNQKKFKKDSSLGGVSSQQYGTRFHLHLEHLMNCEAHCSCGLRNVNRPTFNACKALLKDVHSLNWIPVACEVICWSKELGVATKIDLVAVCRRTGEFIAIEVKTGYGDHVFSSKGKYKLPVPPHGESDCEYVKHGVQAHAAMLLFNDCYKRIDLRCKSAYVVYVNNQKMKNCLNSKELEFSWYKQKYIFDLSDM